MKQLSNSISLELKLLLRSKINYILVILSTYFLYSAIKDGLRDLTLSGYVVQILILGSMLIGYNIFNKERYEGCDELFRCTVNIRIKYFAKIVSSSIYITSINLILTIFTIIWGTWLGEPSIIIKESILYIALYFSLSSLVSIIIGAIIALSIKGKMSYVILIFVSFMIGPLNMQIYEILTGVLGDIMLTKIVALSNLGQYDIHMGFDNLYGFEIESSRFLHHLIYLQLSLIILVLILLMKEKRSRKNLITTILSMTVVISISSYYYNKPSFAYKSGRAEPESRNRYDTYYYWNKKLDYTEKYFDIKSININLDTSKDLKVNGLINIELTEDTDKIVATLYRNFKIKHIKWGDKALNFNQEGDNFQINLDKKYSKGQVISLDINYEGLSSQYFYAGEKAILLPGYFAWLPYPGKTLAMYSDVLVRTTPLLNNNAIDYEITCSGTKNIGSNLFVDGNTLKGTSIDGVTLISGLLNKKDINGIRYYYTLDWNESSLDEYGKELIKNINNMEKTLDINTSTINTVMFIPVKEELLEITQVKTMKVGNTIISASKPRKTENKEVLFNEALGSILNTNLRFSLQDMKVTDIFINEFASWYFKKEQITQDDTGGKNMVSDDSINRILNKIRDLPDNNKRDFFRNWYKKLSEDKIMKLEDVEKLL